MCVNNKSLHVHSPNSKTLCDLMDKEDKFCDLLFVCLHTMSLLKKESTLKVKQDAPKESKFLVFRKTQFSEGR